MFRRGPACALALVLASNVHAAPPDKATCNAAYEQGQRLRKSGDLIAARQKLLLCARDPCPKVFQPECVKWLDEVESILPSVAVAETSGMSAVRVWIDGALATSKLDGSAIDVDPGEHTFRFETDGRPPVEKKVLIVQGDKARRIEVDLAPITPKGETPSPTTTPSASSTTPWSAYALYGIGAAAFASFGYFGLNGLSKRSDLDKCTPHCQQDDIDATRRSFFIADVSLGVGLVAAALGTYLLVSAPSGAKTTTSVGVAPTAKGAGLSLVVTYD